MIFSNIVYLLSLKQSPPISRHPTTGTTPLPARDRGTEMYGDRQTDVPGERDGHLPVLQARQRGYTCSSSPKVTRARLTQAFRLVSQSAMHCCCNKYDVHY